MTLVMYTLIQTAKLNDVDPRAWLADAIARIADTPQTRLADLLPWNWPPIERDRRPPDRGSALPPELNAKFASAAKASDPVADAAEARRGAIDGYQKSVAGKFLGLTAPKDVTRTISGIFGTKTAVRDMTALAQKAAADPEARDGLRKAVGRCHP